MVEPLQGGLRWLGSARREVVSSLAASRANGRPTAIADKIRIGCDHDMDEEFSSAVRPDGRFGVVFEADGETSYFYLLDMAAPEGQQIVSAFKTPDRTPSEPNAEVRWSHDGAVAAAIRGGKILSERGGFFVFEEYAEDSDGEYTFMAPSHGSGLYATREEAERDMIATLAWVRNGGFR